MAKKKAGKPKINEQVDESDPYKTNLLKALKNPANRGRSQNALMLEVFRNTPLTKTQQIMSQATPEFKDAVKQEQNRLWKQYESNISPTNPKRISRSEASGQMMRSLKEFIVGGGPGKRTK